MLPAAGTQIDPELFNGFGLQMAGVFDESSSNIGVKILAKIFNGNAPDSTGLKITLHVPHDVRVFPSRVFSHNVS